MPAGRPTKLTPELKKRILGYLREGNYRVAAVEACGVSYQAFLNWIERGKTEGKGEYFEFVEELKAAEADAEAYAVSVIKSHMTDNWQAAMTFLERRHSDRWARGLNKLEKKKYEAEIELLKAKLAEVQKGEHDGPVEVIFRDYTKEPNQDEPEAA